MCDFCRHIAASLQWHLLHNTALVPVENGGVGAIARRHCHRIRIEQVAAIFALYSKRTCAAGVAKHYQRAPEDLTGGRPNARAAAMTVFQWMAEGAADYGPTNQNIFFLGARMPEKVPDSAIKFYEDRRALAAGGDVGGREIVQDHVHAGEARGGAVLLLPFQRDVLAGSAATFKSSEPEPQVGS
jgi:hypothetical protein